MKTFPSTASERTKKIYDALINIASLYDQESAEACEAGDRWTVYRSMDQMFKYERFARRVRRQEHP